MLERNGENYVVTGQTWGASWEKLEPEIKSVVEEAKKAGDKVYGVELQGNVDGVINVNHHTYGEDDRIEKLAMSRSIIENRFYGFGGNKIHIYNLLLSKIMFVNGNILNGEYKQSQLWKYSISGDVPILMAEIKSIKDIMFVKQLVDAMEYLNLKKVKLDMVVLVDESPKEEYIENKIK